MEQQRQEDVAKQLDALLRTLQQQQQSAQRSQHNGVAGGHNHSPWSQTVGGSTSNNASAGNTADLATLLQSIKNIPPPVPPDQARADADALAAYLRLAAQQPVPAAPVPDAPLWLQLLQACGGQDVQGQAKLLEQVVARLLQQGYSTQSNTPAAMQQLTAQLASAIAQQQQHGVTSTPPPQSPNALATLMQSLSQPAAVPSMYQQGAADNPALSQLLQAASGNAPETWPRAWPNGLAVVQPGFGREAAPSVPATGSASPGDSRKTPRRGTSRPTIPMYIKAVYALLQLPENEGNLTQISDLVAAHPEFAKDLDWTPRPGAKTYPRWKDALLSCFKEGRYPYLEKTSRKAGGSTVYRLNLDALKPEDLQKHLCFLEIPMATLERLSMGRDTKGTPQGDVVPMDS